MQRCMFSMDPSNGSQYRVEDPINLLPLCTSFWERFDYAYILLTPLLKRCTCFFWRNILPKMCLNTCFLANIPLAEIHNKKLVDKSTLYFDFFNTPAFSNNIITIHYDIRYMSVLSKKILCNWSSVFTDLIVNKKFSNFIYVFKINFWSHMKNYLFLKSVK